MNGSASDRVVKMLARGRSRGRSCFVRFSTGGTILSVRGEIFADSVAPRNHHASNDAASVRNSRFTDGGADGNAEDSSVVFKECIRVHLEVV